LIHSDDKFPQILVIEEAQIALFTRDDLGRAATNEEDRLRLLDRGPGTVGLADGAATNHADPGQPPVASRRIAARGGYPALARAPAIQAEGHTRSRQPASGPGSPRKASRIRGRPKSRTPNSTRTHRGQLDPLSDSLATKRRYATPNGFRPVGSVAFRAAFRIGTIQVDH